MNVNVNDKAIAMAVLKVFLFSFKHVVVALDVIGNKDRLLVFEFDISRPLKENEGLKYVRSGNERAMKRSYF